VYHQACQKSHIYWCIEYFDLEAKTEHDDTGMYGLERKKKKKKALMIPAFSLSVHQGEMHTLEMRSRGRREQIFTISVQL
jgi:hypothetical protein